jgi:hypothetical protein
MQAVTVLQTMFQLMTKSALVLEVRTETVQLHRGRRMSAAAASTLRTSAGTSQQQQQLQHRMTSVSQKYAGNFLVRISRAKN